jgi:uncharacterized membrane protein
MNRFLAFLILACLAGALVGTSYIPGAGIVWFGLAMMVAFLVAVTILVVLMFALAMGVHWSLLALSGDKDPNWTMGDIWGWPWPRSRTRRTE